MNFKKLLLGSALVLLPGSLLVAAGYLLFQRFRRKDDTIPVEASNPNEPEDENQNAT
jgi:hypothetical protein